MWAIIFLFRASAAPTACLYAAYGGDFSRSWPPERGENSQQKKSLKLPHQNSIVMSHNPIPHDWMGIFMILLFGT